MIGFNHAAVGGLIAAALPWPVALPLAVASHFVLDALPHYGLPHKLRKKSWFWKVFGVSDFFFSWIVLSSIALSRHHYAVFFCAVAAASPDFIWVFRIVTSRSFELKTHPTRFERWHAGIQKYERSWGIYIEMPVAILLGALVYYYW